MKDSETFKNQTALVTGAGRGIGAATARMLASRGAKVALVSRTAEQLEAVARSIRDAGGEALVCQADVSRAKDMENAVARAADTFGALHLAVNNAGIIIDHKPVQDTSIEDWDRIIGVNLSGIFYGMKYQIPKMIEAGGGAIVNISSVYSDRGFPLNAGYVTA